MFRRSISEATPVAGELPNAFGWVTPGMPVRKVVTRSVRGKFFGAMFGVARAISTSAGRVGLVT